MPNREAPADVIDPTMPPETNKSASATAGEEPLEQDRSAAIEEPRPTANASSRNSRWVDYNTHELLMMISELEDERRWARLREGILWALLLHILLLFSAVYAPRYAHARARSGSASALHARTAQAADRAGVLADGHGIARRSRSQGASR